MPNLKLSESRAESVKSYFISKDISASRITFTGHGSSKPIVNNVSEKERSKNRRVEFIIKK